MASEDYRALNDKRIARARLLAGRVPAAGEVLRFYAALVSFQGRIFPRLADHDSLVTFRQPLVDLLIEHGPEPLHQVAAELDDATLRAAIDAYSEQRDTASPSSFFARVLLQPYHATLNLPPARTDRHRCLRCGHPPQVGALRPIGHGTALTLLCSLCPAAWPFEIGRCTSCGEDSQERFAYYTTSDFPHLRVQACESCHTYLHTVDMTADPAAVPDVDELTALPLDVWAQDQGYRKLQPNLAGI